MGVISVEKTLDWDENSPNYIRGKNQNYLIILFDDNIKHIMQYGFITH